MLRPSLLASAVFLASLVNAEQTTELSPVVVTSPQSDDVLTVTTDPKAPRQPIPAHDGADLLKNIPGFSVIRKGGTDGDPVFRGMAASRLGILLDGEQVMGGCGMRMDPPTAYVYPEAYDQVVVLKGPQSVQHAGSGTAGTVLFERQRPQFHETGIEGHASLLFGSADRNDQVAGITAGNDKGYLRLNGTRSDANNYKDGNGDEVHSAYNRWNADATLGWTPTMDSDIELSTARSDGEARYGDRGMDGAKFEREQHSLNYRVRAVSELISEIEARVYQGYVDHVMDNYSLRPNSGMKMVNNPDREIQGAKVNSTLTPNADITVNLGADWQSDDHSIRKDMGKTVDYQAKKRMEDLSVRNYGLYAEWHQQLDQNQVHAGLRWNKDEAEDKRSGRTTSGDKDKNDLISAFLRFEQQIDNTRWYVGLGHAERAPDYWERMKNPAAMVNKMGMRMNGSASTFDIKPERTTQLDIGSVYKTDNTQASLSAFYANHQDYILIESLSMVASNARNIEAKTWGAEADISYKMTHRWNSNATLAWVHGENESDNTALGQMPPLEARLGMSYQADNWSTGGLLRLVGEQNRVDPKKGNIVGQDIGKTAGFAVFSLNAAYKPMAELTISTGIDNLFDKAYAEHISRNGINIGGLYEVSERINEPGRTFWLKAQWQFN